MLKYRSDRSFIVQSCRGEAPADRGIGTSTSIQHRTHHHEQHTSILTHRKTYIVLHSTKQCLAVSIFWLCSFHTTQALYRIQPHLPSSKTQPPYKQAQHDVEFLIQSYVSLGYPYKPLRAMAARMLSTRR